MCDGSACEKVWTSGGRWSITELVARWRCSGVTGQCVSLVCYCTKLSPALFATCKSPEPRALDACRRRNSASITRSRRWSAVCRFFVFSGLSKSRGFSYSSFYQWISRGGIAQLFRRGEPEAVRARDAGPPAALTEGVCVAGSRPRPDPTRGIEAANSCQLYRWSGRRCPPSLIARRRCLCMQPQ